MHAFPNPVTFLGHTLNSRGTQPLREKVTAIQDFPQPNTKRKLREFLGLVNFYHHLYHSVPAYSCP